MKVRNHGRTQRRILSDDDVIIIWRRLRRGDYQHEIAAGFGINQGRVSEINTGKRGRNVIERLGL